MVANLSSSVFNGAEIVGYKKRDDGAPIYRLKQPIKYQSYDAYTGSLMQGLSYWVVQEQLNELLGNDRKTKLYEKFALPMYASGGMVDFTGPAWVDGTKSKPEAFLSAKDTALIAGLRDILRINFPTGNFGATGAPKNGDVYYQIQINVDELGDEYTVDDLMTEVEERIIQASTKNNVIKIN